MTGNQVLQWCESVIIFWEKLYWFERAHALTFFFLFLFNHYRFSFELSPSLPVDDREPSSPVMLECFHCLGKIVLVLTFIRTVFVFLFLFNHYSFSFELSLSLPVDDREPSSTVMLECFHFLWKIVLVWTCIRTDFVFLFLFNDYCFTFESSLSLPLDYRELSSCVMWECFHFLDASCIHFLTNRQAFAFQNYPNPGN